MIFGCSSGFIEAVYTVAQEYPDVIFEQSGTPYELPNLAAYFGRVYETRFLSGLVAGLMTKNNKIGHVTSFPIAEMKYNINGFALGVKEVNPEATINVVWTNTFGDPAIERAAAESLIDVGVDVISMHQNSPTIMVVAEENGIYGIGYQLDMRPHAPEAVLTTVEWNWGPYYLETVKNALDGTWKPHDAFLGLESGVTRLAPFGDMVPQEVRDLVAEWEAKILSGEFKVFEGPISDNQGNLVIPEGEYLEFEQIQVMDWLADNVISPPTD